MAAGYRWLLGVEGQPGRWLLVVLMKARRRDLPTSLGLGNLIPLNLNVLMQPH